jgi:indolepyruvate ferredoxin oxidoreductase
MKEKIVAEVGDEGCHFIDATGVATALLGDSIASNLFLLGFAWQRGLVPVSAAALEEAIELNAVAVPFNKEAFLWGRRCADQPQVVLRLIENGGIRRTPLTLEEVTDDRAQRLSRYQNAGYAAVYKTLVHGVRQADPRCDEPGSITLTVARNLYKLMAYKDEYEVARLYSDGEFQRKLQNQFEGDYEVRFNLAPPLFSKREAGTGHLVKQEFGSWMMKAFQLLARFRFLRGTTLDVFGYTQERKQERADIEHYRLLVDKLLPDLTEENYTAAQELVALPEKLRGFGHIKDRNRASLALLEGKLWRQFLGEELASEVIIIDPARVA